MVDQLPIITGTRAVNRTATPTSNLIGRGLCAIQNNEIGAGQNEQNTRYRKARDIYNRITDYGRNDEQDTDPISKPQDLVDVFMVLQQLADQGYGKAYFPLARMYQNGQGISIDSEKSSYYSRLAFDWCLANLALNDSEIYVDLGWISIFGLVEEQDDEQVEFLFHKAAEQGDSDSQLNLGWFYENLEKNDEKAVFWYRKAAENGNRTAQFKLGLFYQSGYGCNQNYKEAEIWYIKAAEQGYYNAINTLYYMYYLGRRGVAKDLNLALHFGKKSIGNMQEWDYAERDLGWMNEINKNFDEAIIWYKEGANQGNAISQRDLGWMYEYGRGVTFDIGQAAFWYRKAAEQGEPDAQNSLGYFYQHGFCVARNIEQALFWYRKAAEQGFELAKETLKNLKIN